MKYWFIFDVRQRVQGYWSALVTVVVVLRTKVRMIAVKLRDSFIKIDIFVFLCNRPDFPEITHTGRALSCVGICLSE